MGFEIGRGSTMGCGLGLGCGLGCGSVVDLELDVGCDDNEFEEVDLPSCLPAHRLLLTATRLRPRPR
jgi:hypothetical protein